MSIELYFFTWFLIINQYFHRFIEIYQPDVVVSRYAVILIISEDDDAVMVRRKFWMTHLKCVCWVVLYYPNLFAYFKPPVNLMLLAEIKKLCFNRSLPNLVYTFQLKKRLAISYKEVTSVIKEIARRSPKLMLDLTFTPLVMKLLHSYNGSLILMLCLRQ